MASWAEPQLATLTRDRFSSPEWIFERKLVHSPFSRGRAPRPRGAHWAQPRLVAQVAFTEWTDDGQLRHPRYQGLRDDKEPRDVVRELP